jgi:hypothetical protein
VNSAGVLGTSVRRPPAPYLAALQKLLRAATAKEAKDRPGPLELGREFVTTF